MTVYIKTIKSTIRKSNRIEGEMDDIIKSKKELDSLDLDFYENGSLIFVESENQVYKVSKKEVLKIRKD
jgi:hypothetical protein